MTQLDNEFDDFVQLLKSEVGVEPWDDRGVNELIYLWFMKGRFAYSELGDQNFAEFMSDPQSVTRQIAEMLFASKELVTTGRLSNNALIAQIASEVADLIRDTSSEAGAELIDRFAARDVLDQIDLVELIRTNAPVYVRGRLARVHNISRRWGLFLDDGISKGVVYELVKDQNDDFIKLDRVALGYSATESPYSGAIVTADDLTGTWNTASSNFYTTQPGATFEKSVNTAGTEIELALYGDTRGGIWEFLANDVSIGSVSTWRPTSGVILVRIATGRPVEDADKPLTIKATFTGADPENAPSGGTARGWVHADDSAFPTLRTFGPGAVPSGAVLYATSNKEVAITFKPVGQESAGVWFPEHNGVGTAFALSPATFYVNGVSVGSLLPDTLIYGDSIQVDGDVELRQHVKASFGGTDFMHVWTRHRFDFSEGLLYFNGRLTCLVPTILNGYPAMLPADNATGDMTEFVTATGEHAVNLGDESETNLSSSFGVYSIATVSPERPNVMGAITLLNPPLTYRIGKSGVPPFDQRLFLWHRATGPKPYWKVFDAAEFNTGESYMWSFKLGVGQVDGIYQLLA